MATDYAGRDAANSQAVSRHHAPEQMLNHCVTAARDFFGTEIIV
ncbi:MAG: hypothetical protein WA231_00290 [Methylocella sp.]